MPEIIQNVLYLTTPGLYIQRDHLTLRIERDHALVLSCRSTTSRASA